MVNFLEKATSSGHLAIVCIVCLAVFYEIAKVIFKKGIFASFLVGIAGAVLVFGVSNFFAAPKIASQTVKEVKSTHNDFNANGFGGNGH